MQHLAATESSATDSTITTYHSKGKGMARKGYEKLLGSEEDSVEVSAVVFSLLLFLVEFFVAAFSGS